MCYWCTLLFNLLFVTVLAECCQSLDLKTSESLNHTPLSFTLHNSQTAANFLFDLAGDHDHERCNNDHSCTDGRRCYGELLMVCVCSQLSLRSLCSLTEQTGHLNEKRCGWCAPVIADVSERALVTHDCSGSSSLRRRSHLLQGIPMYVLTRLRKLVDRAGALCRRSQGHSSRILPRISGRRCVF
jgi:hypothetical protein